jgi:diguanylate cyclase (GGDEF)-like protein
MRSFSTTATILLIATSKARRHTLAQQLETLGYNVVTAHDRATVIEAAKLGTFDLWVLDLTRSDDAASNDLSEAGARSLARGVPLLVLSADQPLSPESWTNETINGRVAERAARFNGLNLLDPDSMLFSRRYFDALFDIELERARRSHQPCSVLLIEFGMQSSIGLATWHAIATRLLTSLRRTDLLVRYDSALVLALLPITEAPLARAVALRVLKTLETITSVDHTPLSVTIGLAAYPQHGATAEALLSAVQQALHSAAQSGTIASYDSL